MILIGQCLLLLCVSIFAGSWDNGIWKDEVSASAQGVDVSARIYTRDTSFSKLVFIAEGFDASNETDKEFTLDSLYNSVNGIKDAKSKSIYEQFVLENSYTLLLVDFDDNWEDLKIQGYALGELMQKMWAQSPKTEPIKYIGLSMGGIIGSFACGLKQFYTMNPDYSKESWEASVYNEWDFKVNLCLTVDSPHSGAFIPGSIFCFVNFFKGVPDGGAEAQQYYNSLVSEAACQMLIRKYGTFNIESWKTLYKKVLESFKKTNLTRFVGFSNGSWAGKKQFPSNDNVKIIDWHWDKTGPGEAWADLYSEPEDVSTQKIFWGKWGALYLIGEEMTVDCAPRSELDLFENCPGGYANSYQDVADALPANKPTPVYKSHCFVPTFSAVALDFETYAPFDMRNLKAVEQQLGKSIAEYSPMHKLYHQDDENQWHVRGLAMAPYFVDSIIKEVRQKTVATQMVPVITTLLLD